MDILEDRLDQAPPESLPRPLPLLATAAIAGVLCEIALHGWLVDEARPGIGVSVGALVIVVGLVQGSRIVGRAPDRAALLLYAGAVGFAFLVPLRSSNPIVASNILAFMTMLGLAVTIHHPGSLRPEFASQFGRAAIRVIRDSWFGGFLFAARDMPSVELPTSGRIYRVGVGVLISVPLLLLFGGLFASADERFGDLLSTLWGSDVPDGLLSGALLALLITWMTLGVLRSALTAKPQPSDPSARSVLGSTEASTAMWSLNGLFALFVAFQVVAAVAAYQTNDVSYAQQARSGFFQLLWVAALVVILVLVFDWLVAADRHRLHRQQLILVALTGAVLVSAVVRMMLYIDAYGLTRLRVFTSVFMIWVAFVLFWLSRTVLAERRNRFARPAVAGLLAGVLLLNVINPDGLIASYNLTHQPTVANQIDDAYLLTALSADAVPAIVANLDETVDPCARLAILRDMTIEPSSDVRSWSLSEARAIGAITEASAKAQALCQPD